MKFSNNPRFTPEVEQKIRERLTQAKSKMQSLTAGIYPVSMQTQTTEVTEKPDDKSINKPHSN